jgi:hypothetical protein
MALHLAAASTLNRGLRALHDREGLSVPPILILSITNGCS